MIDARLVAGPGPPLEVHEFPALHLMVKNLDAALREEGLGLEVGRALVERRPVVRDVGEPAPLKRLGDPLAAVPIPVDHADFVSLGDVRDLGHDGLKVHRLAAPCGPALQHVLDDAQVSARAFGVDHRGREGIRPAAGGVHRQRVAEPLAVGQLVAAMMERLVDEMLRQKRRDVIDELCQIFAGEPRWVEALLAGRTFGPRGSMVSGRHLNSHSNALVSPMTLIRAGRSPSTLYFPVTAHLREGSAGDASWVMTLYHCSG